jgi:hypothetical protein
MTYSPTFNRLAAAKAERIAGRVAERQDTLAAEKASAILTTPDAILDYLLAGRAVLTIVNRQTGGRFTFKITRAEAKSPNDPPTWFVAALAGTDHYQYLGFIRAGRYLPNLLKVAADAPTQKAASWLLPRMLEKHPLPGSVDVLHSGRCGRCGRTLTTPDSIERGLGPECAHKAIR